MTIGQPSHEGLQQPTSGSNTTAQQATHQDARRQNLVACANEYAHLVQRAPELTFFTQNYIEQYQTEILSLEPDKHGATTQLRKVLGNLVHDTLDALLADLLVAVKVEQRKMSADDDAIGMTETEPLETDVVAAQQDVLGQKVKMELESLVELAKDAVDEELLGLQEY